jgi:hypothetical protein
LTFVIGNHQQHQKQLLQLELLKQLLEQVLVEQLLLLLLHQLRQFK